MSTAIEEAAPSMSQIESVAAMSDSSLQRPSRRKIFGKTSNNKSNNKAKLKSFKGFITGKSRRDRRASSSKALSLVAADEYTSLPAEPTLATAHSAESRGNDEETVYGMELDNASSASAVSDNVKAADKGGAVDIVLLLMDNETRRFELLQVDVDSPSALVKDILVKVPEHATEPSLKFKTFGIVCDRYGHVLDTSKSLADFFTVLAETCSSEAFSTHHTFLLIAVASSNPTLKGADCAKLAKPILTHSKIAHMVRFFFKKI